MKHFFILFLVLFSKGFIVAQSCAVTISNTTPSICIGGSAVLSASGATTYTWSTGATTASISVSPTVTTSYAITGISGTCTNVATTTITVNPLPTTGITSSASYICVGGSAILTATGATTYSWSTGATTASISVNPTITTNYSVTSTSSFGCTKTATVPVTLSCYKTLWTNFGGSKFRNDSILIDPTKYFYWPYTTSKNTLRAHTDGWAEIIVKSGNNYIMMGFHDSTSVGNHGYSDIDYGVLKQNSSLRYVINGVDYSLTSCTTGDLIRIERIGTTFYIKKNGVTQYTTTVSVAKDWKIKVALNVNSISNITASFVDSTGSSFPYYVQQVPKIKHCSVGLSNGSISLSPKISGTSQTYTWAPGGSTSSSITSLGVGIYTVDAKDANSNLSKQKYEIGYKTNWTNFSGTIFRRDSIIISSSLIVWPSAVSKNTLKRNTDGWAQLVIDKSTDYLMFGFHDSTSVTHNGYTDIDYGFYKNLTTCYYILGGTFGVIGNAVEGDVMRIERIGNTFYLKRNGGVIYSTTVSAARNWKLKVALNTNGISNIGSSFIDSTGIDFPNYVRNIPFIRHTDDYIDDGSIQLSSISAGPGNSYTWTAAGEITAGVYNKPKGYYNVITADAFQNTSSYNYDILFKTKWTNLNSCTIRNDTVMNTYGHSGWSTAVGENILKANKNGKVSWIVDNTSYYRMLGFADTISGIAGAYSDIDQGVYEIPTGRLYHLVNGSYHNIASTFVGDIISIERTSNTINFYVNSALVYSTTATNTNLDWKLKTVLYTGASIANVGASFTEPKLEVMPYIKHASKINSTDGAVTVKPKDSNANITYSWSSNGQALSQSTLTNLSYGNYDVIITDTTKKKQNHFYYNVLFKSYWTLLQGGSIYQDSIISTVSSSNFATFKSKNELFPTADADISWIGKNITGTMVIGFIDTLSNTASNFTDIDAGIYQKDTSLYSYVNGTKIFIANYKNGDIIRINRSSNIISYYLNEGNIYTKVLDDGVVNWKVKLALSGGQNYSNIGFNFTNPKLLVNSRKINTNCDSTNKGSIELYVSGGYPPYTYQWSNSTTNSSLFQLNRGTYSVTITDNANDTIIRTFFIDSCNIPGPDTIIIKNLFLNKEVLVLPYNDTINVTKYNLASSIKVGDTSLVKDINLEVIETSAYNSNDSLITSLLIEKVNIKSSTFNNNQTAFFMEGEKIYFNINNLDYFDRRRLKITVRDHNNNTIQVISNNLY